MAIDLFGRPVASRSIPVRARRVASTGTRHADEIDVVVQHGDCREVIKTLADDSVSSCVTDPPYNLQSINKRFAKVGRNDKTFFKVGVYQRHASGFMNQKWDTGEVAHDPEWWAEVYRVLKPGAHLVAFGGTRTYHRLACAVEDAGFEIRDQLAWMFRSGFPKSHDVSKGIDAALGAERSTVRVKGARNPKVTGGGRDGMKGGTRPFIERAKINGYHETVSDEAVSDEAALWQGWGTGLKPALEPVVLARKPLSESTVAANVLRWGCGALNIGGCLIDFVDEADSAAADADAAVVLRGMSVNRSFGHWGMKAQNLSYAELAPGRWPADLMHDGSCEVGVALADALRLFYSAKADREDRWGSKHPTVKPVDLMRWLIRLVTPPGGIVLDPFAGSGSTGCAAVLEGFDCVLIEREDKYVEDLRRKLKHFTEKRVRTLY